MPFRIGYGYDVHQLAPGEEFWLGGIQLDHTHGAVGHSDADVLLHVICDALLGALALRDIGYHFPDTDPQYKGVDSKKLLQHTYDLITEAPHPERVFRKLQMSWRPNHWEEFSPWMQIFINAKRFLD